MSDIIIIRDAIDKQTKTLERIAAALERISRNI